MTNEIGDHTLEYRSTDMVGNVEDANSVDFAVADRRDDTDTFLYYDDDWAETSGAEHYAGTLHYSGTASATVAFRFAITYEIKLGLFHDSIAYYDRQIETWERLPEPGGSIAVSRPATTMPIIPPMPSTPSFGIAPCSRASTRCA